MGPKRSVQRSTTKGVKGERYTRRQKKIDTSCLRYIAGKRNSKIYNGDFGTPRISQTCNNTLSKLRTPPLPSAQSQRAYSASSATSGSRLSTSSSVFSTASGTSVKWDEQGLETVCEQLRKNSECQEVLLHLLKE